MRSCIKQSMRPIKIVTVFILSLTVFPSVLGAKIHLKNGRVMEGVVEKEDDAKIKLNVGFGTVTLKKEEIEHIEGEPNVGSKTLEDKWRDKYFLRHDFVPEGYKEIAQSLKKLKKLRNKVRRDQADKNKILEKLKKVNASIDEDQKALLETDKKMASVNKNAVPFRYNALVNEHNTLIAQMKLATAEAKKLKDQAGVFDAGLSQYLDTVGFLRNALKGARDALSVNSAPEERQFIKNAQELLDEFSKAFKTYEFEFTRRGSHFVVTALLNNAVTASLVVDTGASFVVLSRNVAKRLRIDSNAGVPMSVTVADGRTVAARGIVLKSVKVGDARVEYVRAAVMEEELGQLGDGLLGMSFLEHFTLRMDTKTNTFSLQGFTP